MVTEQRARDLIFDMASSREDWELPEPKAVFSAETAIAAMLAFARASTIPDGFVVVPREPSEVIEQAYYEAHAKAETLFASFDDVWSAMIAAAPSPQ